ncbi:WD40 repeat-like protein [Clavulina sp. PMI_390]|nr:WD40 repeat-like protein [Clavulina sp. PMI_390]
MANHGINNNPKLSADEVNTVVHSYLLDSGFDHAAYVLQSQAHLDRSPHRNISLPRGELVSLLKKAVIFRDVEEMLKNKTKGKDESSAAGSGSLLARYHTDGNPPLPPPDEPARMLDFTAAGQTSSSAVSQPTPMATDAAGEDGRPKKRSRSDEEENQTYPIDPENVVRKGPVKLPAGIVLGPDGQPPGTIVLRGHEAEVFACHWNPVFFNILASGGKGGNVILWNVPTPAHRNDQEPNGVRSPVHSIIAVLRPPPPTDGAGVPEVRDLTSMAWSRDGKHLAVGHQDSSIHVWNVKGEYRCSFRKHKAPVFDIAWSDDSTRLISAGLDGLSMVWDPTKPRLAPTMVHHGHEANTCCLDVEWLGNNFYASAGTDHRIAIYHREQPDPLTYFKGHQDEVNQIRLSPDCLLLVSVSDDKVAMVWDVSQYTTTGWTNSRMDKLKEAGGLGLWTHRLAYGHEKPISMVQWSPTKYQEGYNLLATFSREDKTACLWDIRKGTVLRKFTEHSPGVPIKRDLFTHCFDPTGRFYCLGGVCFLILYDIWSAKPLWTWTFGDSYVADIVWDRHHEGRRFAIAKENGVTVVIDLAFLGVPELAELPTRLGTWHMGTLGPRKLPDTGTTPPVQPHLAQPGGALLQGLSGPRNSLVTNPLGSAGATPGSTSTISVSAQSPTVGTGTSGPSAMDTSR